MNWTTRLLTGMISGAGSVIIKIALNILLIPILIYSLGIELYGLYVLLIGLVELLLIMDLGFTSAIIKELGACQTQNRSEKAQELLKLGHYLYASLSALILVIGLILMPWFTQAFHLSATLAETTRIVLPLILLEGALGLYTCYYRSILLAHCLHQWANISDTLFNILSNSIGLFLLLAGYGLPALLISRLCAALLRTILLIVQALKVEPHALAPQAPFRLKTMMEIVRLSVHATMVNLSVIISHKIDNFVIAAFLSLRMVGVFEIVFRFLGIALQVTSKIAEVVLPMFSRVIAMAQQDKARYLFLRMSCLNNLVVSLLLLLIVSFYPQLFQLFSAGQIPIGPTIPILMIAIPCVWSGALQMPAGYYLFASGRQSYLSQSSLIAALCNLALSLMLIKPFGLVGVAVGTLIPQLIQHQAGLIRESCKALRITLWEYISSVHLSVLPALVSVFLWIQVLRPLTNWGIASWIPLGLIALSGVLVGGWVWYTWSSTPGEKAFLTERILNPLKCRLIPTTGAANG